MREPLRAVEFAYLGPPPELEWRQPELGMRTSGRRVAVNTPHGFDYDVRAISDPYRSGDGEVWLQTLPEDIWYRCRIFGWDVRLHTKPGPAYLMWLLCRVGGDGD